MARVQFVNPQTAAGDATTLRDAVQSQLGVTPKFVRVLANSPKALEGFLGLYRALAVAKAAAKSSKSSLSLRLIFSPTFWVKPHA